MSRSLKSIKIEHTNSNRNKINVFAHFKDNIINTNDKEKEILSDFGIRLEHFERKAKTEVGFPKSCSSII